MIDILIEEYKRHESSILNPALWAILNYRFGVWANARKNILLKWLCGKIYGFNSFIILITSGIRLNREAVIGKDFHLIHSGNIQIGPEVVIGDRVGIQQDVTIGGNMEKKGMPRIGNDVYIGAGAKILGPIVIGNNVRIAANSLVINDVPDNTTAIGVPARVMKYTGRK